MAMGFSGSNGGISLTCRVLALTDIKAGLNKSRSIVEQAPEEVKPLYKTIVSDLSLLYERLDKMDIEKTNQRG